MTDGINIRELVLEILLAVTKEEEYSHIALSSVLEKHQYLTKQERSFITRVSEGTLENMIELDYIIDQFSNTKVKDETGDPVHFAYGCVSAQIYGLCTGIGSM